MAFDINATLNNMLESMKAVGQGKSGEKAEDLLGELIQAFNRAFGGFCKIFNLGFVNKLLDTGADAGLKHEGVASSMIQKSSGPQGGALANAFSSFLTFDFKGLVSGAVEPIQHMVADMHGTHISYGELGSLTPMVTFGGSVVSQGISIA